MALAVAGRHVSVPMDMGFRFYLLEPSRGVCSSVMCMLVLDHNKRIGMFQSTHQPRLPKFAPNPMDDFLP